MKRLIPLVIAGALLAGCSTTDTGSRTTSYDDKSTMTGSRIPKSNSGSKTADPQAIDDLMRSRNTMRPGASN